MNTFTIRKTFKSSTVVEKEKENSKTPDENTSNGDLLDFDTPGDEEFDVSKYIKQTPKEGSISSKKESVGHGMSPLKKPEPSVLSSFRIRPSRNSKYDKY